MIFNKILKAFPVPKFLNLPFAGISITDSYIHCIQFGEKYGKLYIEKYAEREIPAGLISSGIVSDTGGMLKILQNLKKDLNLSYVKISLPEEKAYISTTKIPMVKKEEILVAVESKIEENVPVSPKELIFDYQLVPHLGQDHLDVVLAALPIKIVEMYVEMAVSAGLIPLSLEIESQAVAMAVLTKGNIETVLIIRFGRAKVGLYVVNQGIVRFTSTVQFAKDQSGSRQSFLSAEIKKLYIYWHTLKENTGKSERKISQIIVCGENIEDNIVPYLSAENSSPVFLGNAWAKVFDTDSTLPDIPFFDSLRYVTAIGLALPSDIFI